MPIDPAKRDPETGRLYFIRADHEDVRCDLLECAGMTLHAAIESARKNQVNVLGLNGMAYNLLRQEEVTEGRKWQQEQGDGMGAFVCDHEMWASPALKPGNLPLPSTCESA